MSPNQIQRRMRAVKIADAISILKACRYRGEPKNYQPYGQTVSYLHLK